MSVCPFCKAQVTQSSAPCPRCGKLASDHPSIAAISGRTLSTDFDDDDHGELSLESGGRAGDAAASHAAMPYESGKGVTLDDDLFGDDNESGPLELDVPDKPPSPSVPDLSLPAGAPPGSSRKPAAPGSDPRIGSPAASAATSSSRLPAAAPVGPPSSGRLPAAPPPAPSSSSGRFAVSPDSSPDVTAPEPPPPPSAADQAAVKIANYPPAPQKVWQAPKYALQVLYRQFELKQDLESLRRKRSPDVGLYERAIRAHDPKMLRTGLAITGLALFFATVLFFMPVIKRFAFAPD
jgi:hypothetical protein